MIRDCITAFRARFWAKAEEGEIMKIIVGLGNPTDQYKGTRHNIGFMAIDKIAEANKITINQHKHKAMVGAGFIGAERVLLMKPLTYMNLSGESIRAAADFYKIAVEDILVIYDDISLEPGKLRIRKKGSAGGHNGIKSIIQHMGGDVFPRIRVGIGGERHPGMDLADYVLGHFSKEELVVIDEALDHAAKAAELIIQDEIDTAMNLYNAKKEKKKKKKAAEKQADSDVDKEASEAEKTVDAKIDSPVEVEKKEEKTVVDSASDMMKDCMKEDK